MPTSQMGQGCAMRRMYALTDESCTRVTGTERMAKYDYDVGQILTEMENKNVRGKEK